MVSWAVGVATTGLVLVGWVALPLDRFGADGEDSTYAETDAMQPRARRGGPGVDLTRLGVVHGARRARHTDYAALWGHDHGDPADSALSAPVSRGDLKLLSQALETRASAPRTIEQAAAPAPHKADSSQALAIMDGINRLLALVSGPDPRSFRSAASEQGSTMLHRRPIPKARVLQAL